MSSQAKIAANRRNAQRSTGPRSADGRLRTRHNAFQHGLSIPVTFDQRAADRVDDLSLALAPDSVDVEQDFATLAAEAQVEIERVRQAKVDLVNQSTKRFAGSEACQLPAGERAALAFAARVKTLSAFDRYEGRALSRRNRALRALKEVQTVILRAERAERVGPPRPKQPRNRSAPFKERNLALDLGSLLKLLAKAGPGRDASLQWYHGEQVVAGISFSATIEGDDALLSVEGRAWGEDVRQAIMVARKPTKVGGATWSFECPQTGKIVKRLYLVPGGRYFRSRQALGLTYRVSNLTPSDRYRERAFRFMERLGASDPDHKPPRPKHMHRSTYNRLWLEVQGAYIQSMLAFLGWSVFDLRWDGENMLPPLNQKKPKLRNYNFAAASARRQRLLERARKLTLPPNRVIGPGEDLDYATIEDLDYVTIGTGSHLEETALSDSPSNLASRTRRPDGERAALDTPAVRVGKLARKVVTR